MSQCILAGGIEFARGDRVSMMDRRSLLKSIGAAAGVAAAGVPRLAAAIPKTKITRVRMYAPPERNALFNQSNLVVTVETDAGITGIGEGGSKDMLEQCAGRLIGQDPQFIERLWQDMSRSFFYPPGREKEHALGALDLALWDIKGKVRQVPVHELLGGMARNYCECYNTAGIIPGSKPGMSVKERAQLTIAAGYRAFRMGAADQPINTVYNTRERVLQLYHDCEQARAGVGDSGDWVVDFHQRFDLSDAVRACDLIQNLAPFFCRRSGAHGGLSARHSNPAPQGERAHRGGRRVGQSLGLQHAGRESRHRLRPRHTS